MAAACEDLDLKKLFVIYPGQRDYAINDRIEVVGFMNLKNVISLVA